MEHQKDRRYEDFMKIREAFKTVEKRCIVLLRWFLRVAILFVLVGIFVAAAFQNILAARYLLILSVILVSQGVWGAVFLDCCFRRLGKKE